MPKIALFENFGTKNHNFRQISHQNFRSNPFISILWQSVLWQQAPWWSYAKFEVIFAVNYRGGTLKIGLVELFWTTETLFFDSKHVKTAKIGEK